MPNGTIMFDAPKKNEFTQGTVFSCAYGENYKDGPVYGLVITARCDAAQEKVPVFNYVPLVPLSSWILNEGAALVLERIEADCLNTIRNYLKAAKLSDSLLKSHSPDAIYDAHFRAHENEKGRKSQCDKFCEAAKQFNETHALLLGGRIDTQKLKEHLVPHQGKVDAVLKELAGHRLAGYYLLRELESLEDGDSGDYVALLREVHHIPSSVAKQIAKGISAEDGDFEGAFSICPKFRLKDDISLPVGKLKSPWIEHLMQNFAMLFSRIGVKDNDFEDIKKSLSNIGLGG